MGSASRVALANSRKALDEVAKGTNIGAELLQAAQQLDNTPALLQVVADAAVGESVKSELIAKVFAPASTETKKVLAHVANERWSNASDLAAGVEDLGIRAAAINSADLDEELLAIEKLISSDHELELTLGSKLIDADRKVGLLQKLLATKVQPQALQIVTHTVANPRGKRIGRALQDFAKIIADQAGQLLATVTVAAPLDEQRQAKLQEALTAKKGQPVKITTVVDPKVIGGMKIRIADEIIDATVQTQLDHLRLKLAL